MTDTTTIFSVDATGREDLELFMHVIKENKLERFIKPLIGCYKGQQEPSFIMSTTKFNEFVRSSSFVAEQTCFLEVTRCNWHYATLHYRDGRVKPLGRMIDVSEKEAKRHDFWSYDPSQKLYFITREINLTSFAGQESWRQSKAVDHD